MKQIKNLIWIIIYIMRITILLDSHFLIAPKNIWVEGGERRTSWSKEGNNTNRKRFNDSAH